MGRFCSTPPTSSSIFSSFLQLSTPLQAWIVQDIQVFQIHGDFLTGPCGFCTIQENSAPKLWKCSIFLGRHAPFGYLQNFPSFEMYLLLQFSTFFNHSTSHLFRTFRPSKLPVVFLIASSNFQLFSFKVEQLFNFLENLTLKSMGRFTALLPLLAVYFLHFFSYQPHSRPELFRTFRSFRFM